MQLTNQLTFSVDKLTEKLENFAQNFSFFSNFVP